MQFEGVFTVKGSREKAFGLLLDPNKISECMPALQKIEVKSLDDYVVVVRTGVSFIKGDFTLHFTVQEKDVPSHAKLAARGYGMGSTIDLVTTFDLVDGPGRTTSMKWQAEAKIGGRIASLGQRLLAGQAEKIIKQLFECLQSKLELTQ